MATEIHAIRTAMMVQTIILYFLIIGIVYITIEYNKRRRFIIRKKLEQKYQEEIEEAKRILRG